MLSKILDPQNVRFAVKAQSKKKAFELIAQLFATNQDISHQNAIFDGLVARERLGNTGLGFGVGLPHCRLADITKPQACFILLREGIDYDVIDNLPVDLLFSLVVPLEADEEHLGLLAEIARLFHEEAFRQSLRQASSPNELYQRLTSAST